MNKPIITQEFLATLKELAKKATKGPWQVHYPQNTSGWGYCVGPSSHCLFQLRGRVPGLNLETNEFVTCKERKIADANYLAAVSPDVILALIEELEKLGTISPDDVGSIGKQQRDFKAVIRAWWNRFQDTPITVSEVIDDCYCEDGDFLEERQTLRGILNAIQPNNFGVNGRVLSAWLRKNAYQTADNMTFKLSVRNGKKRWKVVKIEYPPL